MHRNDLRFANPPLDKRHTVLLCPAELEYCDRADCAGGHCEKSGERTLDPCNGCGTLVVVRGVGICVDCPADETHQTKEA